ncbi:hypothetical protein VTN77DRAFT_2275 [Rasamsonia byssochlamydoides]|uniref:uncharacterized protein n=1 Tax=Rasamsonia byssochlamydoides TaxID=89139 RepID=UPI003744168C
MPTEEAVVDAARTHAAVETPSSTTAALPDDQGASTAARASHPSSSLLHAANTVNAANATDLRPGALPEDNPLPVAQGRTSVPGGRCRASLTPVPRRTRRRWKKER